MPFILFKKKRDVQRDGIPMFIGRVAGWFLIFLAVLAASAEAVVALGTPGEYVSIATSDVITIITGLEPQVTDTFAGKIMVWPAWVIIGSLGILLTVLCRRKKYKTGFSSK